MLVDIFLQLLRQRLNGTGLFCKLLLTTLRTLFHVLQLSLFFRYLQLIHSGLLFRHG